MSSEALEQLLGIDPLLFDLYEGTVVDGTDTRIIFLSTDILRGIHAALSYEAGDAWRVVMKRCGLLWGQRTFRHLSRHSQTLLGVKFDAAPVDAFASFLRLYMSGNGWGTATVDLGDAVNHGLVHVRLQNSLYSEVLNEQRERVEYLIAGMLAGLFGELARTELDCVEIQSALTGGDGSWFVISDKARLAPVEAMLAQGAAVDELLARLRSH